MSNENSTITEAQCVAFLKARAMQLQQSTGRNLATVELCVSAFGGAAGESQVLMWRAYVDGAGSITNANTLAEACAAVKALATPENIAKTLRAEAAALIAKADALATPSAN